MSKSKLFAIKRELNKAITTVTNTVFFVDIVNGKYVITKSGNVRIGEYTKTEFEDFKKRYDGTDSVLIINDIPDERDGRLSDWII